MPFFFPEIYTSVRAPSNECPQVPCSPLHRAGFSLALSPRDLAAFVVIPLYKTRARA
jgi:hypothetical protein